MGGKNGQTYASFGWDDATTRNRVGYIHPDTPNGWGVSAANSMIFENNPSSISKTLPWPRIIRCNPLMDNKIKSI